MRLTPEHEAFRATVRALVDREINPAVDAWEAEGSFPAHELFPRLAEVGLLGLEYDPADGGGGADHYYTLVACEELGRVHAAGVSMAIGVQSSMATPALATFGSPELRAQFLAPALAGRAVAAIAVTEPGAGSDVSAITTRAERDGDTWVISGTKTFITNGQQADWVCLLARTSPEGGYRGLSQIIVPTTTPGFRVARTLDKLGNRSSDTAELVLDAVRVPVANTIGTPGRGFEQQMRQFVTERLTASYTVAAQCRHALERTHTYLEARETFGSPLADKQYVAFTMAELSAKVDLLVSHNHQCADDVVAGLDVTRGATVAKLTAGRLAREVADLCLQFHGGLGYMEENWTARFFRDMRLASIGAGADEVMLKVLARLEGYPA